MNSILKSCIFLGVVIFCHVQGFKIGINHFNDVNGQIEAYLRDTHSSAAAPVSCGKNASECVGGLVSLCHWRYYNQSFGMTEEDNIFHFSTGNMIGGVPGWIQANGEDWAGYGHFTRIFFTPQAATLGVNEFGAGLRQTVDFMGQYIESNSTWSLVNSNCEDKSFNATIEGEFCAKLRKSFVPVNATSNSGTVDYTIGVIGFIDPKVEFLAMPGKLKFSDPAEKIKEMIQRDGANVKTFVAIGDGDETMAKKIMDLSDKVKLVIFGTSFGNTPDMSDYPMKYKHGYIATASRYGAKLGKLLFDVVDDTGNLTLINATLMETTNVTYSPRAQALLGEVNRWRGTVHSKELTTVGVTRVNLEGGRLCWTQECLIGNLMADAAVHCVIQKFTRAFPFPLVSVYHGGAFFDGSLSRPRSINVFNISKILPYYNDIHLVKVMGSDLRNLFKISAGGLNPGKAKTEDWGQLLQVSRGLQVHYDTLSSDSPKVTNVRIHHDDAGTTSLRDMLDEKEYYLAIPTFLFEQRGVYANGLSKPIWIETEFDNHTTAIGLNDDLCLINYIKSMKQVAVAFEQRILVDDVNDRSRLNSGNTPALQKALLFIAAFLLMIRTPQ